MNGLKWRIETKGEGLIPHPGHLTQEAPGHPGSSAHACDNLNVPCLMEGSLTAPTQVQVPRVQVPRGAGTNGAWCLMGAWHQGKENKKQELNYPH